MFLLISEKKDRKRKIEISMMRIIDQLPPAYPYWGLSPQPGHVPLIRIKPGILQSTGQCSIL
jgi:hypothetical protein